MAVMDTVLGFVADIGLDAAKERFKLKQDEIQARAKLMDYLARQQKYNFNCSLEEEPFLLLLARIIISGHIMALLWMDKPI